MRNYKGKNNSNWKGGKVRLICICGNNFYVKPYRLKRSKHLSCSTKCSGILKKKFYIGENNPNFDNHKLKDKWKDLEYRNKITKVLFNNLTKRGCLKPNKCESTLGDLLKQILPDEYKYVGNAKLIIDSFNPDFINCNGQKKIIELFGDYWHNLPSYRKRDKRRLKTYKKYGYKTLIIWQHELKNLEKVKVKILKFNK